MLEHPECLWFQKLNQIIFHQTWTITLIDETFLNSKLIILRITFKNTKALVKRDTKLPIK